LLSRQSTQLMTMKQAVTPPTRSCANHTRKCTRSRIETHGKISQHNSRHKQKAYKLYIISQGPRGLEYISLSTRVSGSISI
jgi:hypothetical protein